MIEVNTTLHTDGTGYWSSMASAVPVVGLHLAYVDDTDEDFGEFRVYFDTTWDIDDDGLIYTDPQFEEELIDYLNSIGITGGIWYSEQGMQGRNYVSFDCDGELIRTFRRFSSQKVA